MQTLSVWRDGIEKWLAELTDFFVFKDEHDVQDRQKFN